MIEEGRKRRTFSASDLKKVYFWKEIYIKQKGGCECMEWGFRLKAQLNVLTFTLVISGGFPTGMHLQLQ